MSEDADKLAKSLESAARYIPSSNDALDVLAAAAALRSQALRIGELERERDEAVREQVSAVDFWFVSESERVRLREALEPFAKVGRLIDGPFGPALFKKDDQAFQSGCAWTENGEPKTLTWGDFRKASEALALQGGGGDQGASVAGLPAHVASATAKDTQRFTGGEDA